MRGVNRIKGGVTDQGQDKNEFTGLNTRSAKDWEAYAFFCFSLGVSGTRYGVVKSSQRLDAHLRACQECDGQ